MIIAVTYENGDVFQHFGHTAAFKFYDIKDNKIVSSEIVNTNGSGHGALSAFLGDHKVNKLICGGIGSGAKTARAEMNIEIFGGVSGNADKNVEDYLQIKFVAIIMKMVMIVVKIIKAVLETVPDMIVKLLFLL